MNKLSNNKWWVWVIAILTVAASFTYSFIAFIQTPWIFARVLIAISMFAYLGFLYLCMTKPLPDTTFAIVLDSVVTGMFFMLMLYFIIESVYKGLVLKNTGLQITLFGGELIGILKVMARDLRH